MLFPKDEMPRAAPIKRMHVTDAGNFPNGSKCIAFRCKHCGLETGWIADEWTITQNKRGHPCPACNQKINPAPPEAGA